MQQNDMTFKTHATEKLTYLCEGGESIHTTIMERLRNRPASRNFKLNCLELVLGAISVIGYVPWYKDIGSVITRVFGVQFGFVLLTLLIIMGHVMELSMHRNLLLTCSILGSIVWIATGVFLGWLYVLNAVFVPFNVVLISAAATITNGVIHVIDASNLCRCQCCTYDHDKDDQHMVDSDTKNLQAIILPSDDCVKC